MTKRSCRRQSAQARAPFPGARHLPLERSRRPSRRRGCGRKAERRPQYVEAERSDKPARCRTRGIQGALDRLRSRFLDRCAGYRRGSVVPCYRRRIPDGEGAARPRLQRHHGGKELTHTTMTTGYGAAISDGFEYLLANHPSVFTIGQGLWSPWYVGNSMTDLDSQFGRERVIDTPVSELGVHRRGSRRCALRISSGRDPSARGFHAARRRSARVRRPRNGDRCLAGRSQRQSLFVRSSIAAASRARSTRSHCSPGSRTFPVFAS